MPYLNLDLNYFDHTKTMRLESRLGNGSDVLPIRLWAYVGRHSPELGRLAMLDSEIERVCRWWGEKGAMVAAMIEIGFIERDGDFYQVHDWLDHSGHLACFKKRSIKANRIRWGNKKKLRTPTRTPRCDVKDSSCSAVPFSAVHSSAIPSMSASPKPYPLPDPKTNPTACLVVSYKTRKGVAYDSREWDGLNWGRCAAASKTLLSLCVDIATAEKCLSDIGEDFDAKGITWTLETIAKHAPDWLKKNGRTDANSSRAGLRLAIAQRSAERKDQGAVVAVSSGSLSTSIRDGEGSQDRNEADD